MSNSMKDIVDIGVWAAHNNHFLIVDGVLNTLLGARAAGASTEKLEVDEIFVERLRFYNFIKSIADMSYCNKTHLIQLLKQFDEIHKLYFNQLEDVGIIPLKWLGIRKSLMQHIGLAIILNALNIEESEALKAKVSKDDKEVNVSVSKYNAIIDELVDTLLSLAFYENEDIAENAKSSVIVNYEKDYYASGTTALTNMFSVVTTTRKNKSSTQVTYSNNKLMFLLSDMSLESLSREIISHTKDIENKILAWPELKVKYHPPGEMEDVSLIQEEEWSEERAKVSGPYSAEKNKTAMRQSLIASASKQVAIKAEDSHVHAHEVMIEPKPKQTSKSTKQVPTTSSSSSSSSSSSNSSANVVTTPTKSTNNEHTPVSNLKHIRDNFIDKIKGKDPLLAYKSTDVTSKSKKSIEVEEPKRSKKNADKNDDNDLSPKKSPKKRSVASVSKPKDLSPKKKLVNNKRKATTVAFDDEDEDDDDDIEDSDDDFKGSGEIKTSKAVGILAKMSIPPKVAFPQSLADNASASSPSNIRQFRKERSKMGKRVKWGFEEENALLEAVKDFGIGNWSTVINSSKYSNIFRHRSNVDLKDKYRNMMKNSNRDED